MKIIRFRFPEGEESYGKLQTDDIIRKIEGDIFSEYKITDQEFSKSQVEILSPVKPPNIIAIGLNYYEHARETGHTVPEEPVIFLKATSSVIGWGQPIKIPGQAPDKVDYEAELGVVIGSRVKNISRDEVDNVIFGYTCVNDVTARDCQEGDEQWARAKSFDTFCPAGPYIETSLNTNECMIKTRLNGETMQNSRTDDMIFSVSEIVSYCSRNMTLLPGTLIITGTPPGVGKGHNPPRYLKEQDVVEIEIEGLGTLKNNVIKE